STVAQDGSGAPIIFNGDIDLGSFALTFDSGDANSTISTVITGSGAFTKIGDGTLTLSGSSPNTYTGLTTVDKGKLILQKLPGMNAVRGDIFIGDKIHTVVLQLGASNQIADTSSIVFDSGGQDHSAIFMLAGFNETVRSVSTTTNSELSIIQAFDLFGTGASTLTLNLDVDAEFNGVIRDQETGTGATLSLVKNGPGTFTWRNSSIDLYPSYTGQTQLQAGRLIFSDQMQVATPVAIGSSVANALTFQQQSNPLVYSGVISGNGPLTITGAQPVTFTGSTNSFSGLITIQGELVVSADGALGAAANDVIVDGTGRITAAGSFTSARHFIATGSDPTVKVNEPRTLTLTGLIDGTLRKVGSGKLLFGGAFSGSMELPAGTTTTTVGQQKLNIDGDGRVTLTVVRGPDNKPRIGSLVLEDTTSATNITVTAIGAGITYLDRITSLDPADNVGTIKLSPNVVLGNGVNDAVADVDIRGKVARLLLNDVRSYTLFELGKGLSYLDTYDNKPDITLRNVLGPG
ncbi:MAG: hypothetical protein EBU88_16995, partial [Acidobacteria bacterium]|nr:hypothetical protein [Acidobacteriota bacterium]